MKGSTTIVNLAIIALMLAMVLSITVTYTGIVLFASNTGNSNVVATLTVPTQCQIAISNTAITFPSTAPGSGSGVNNAVSDTNNGNTAAYISVYGANWLGSNGVFPYNFFVTNTVWDLANDGASMTIGNQLTYAITNSQKIIGTVTTNTIYFGVNVPNGQAANTYTQNIAIVNTC